MSQITVAVIQMSPQGDYGRNIERAGRLLVDAASRGAGLAVLPEMFSGIHPAERWHAMSEPAGGPTEQFLSARAAACGMYIVGGSYVERAGEHFFNTSAIFGPDGGLVGRYRKVHLFWTDIPGRTRYDERALISPGAERFAFEAEGFLVSVGICYDLRFPEFFRAPGRPADLCCLPAAFMQATGQAHWETLVRARAIENLAYVAAADTVGRHYEIPGRPGEAVVTHGHSMIVSPWGQVLSSAGEGEEAVLATVTREGVEEARRRLGALDHIREDLWPRR